jgi:hypothetical protein
MDEDDLSADDPEEPEGGAPAEGEQAAEEPGKPRPLPKTVVPARVPPTATAKPGATGPTRLVSEALGEAPPTDTPPPREPTEEEKVASAADRYVRKYGGDPADPESAKKALAKALSDDTRLSTLTREKERQDAVIAELRSRVAAVEHLRDDYLPPPVEVDPDDLAQVDAVVDRLASKNDEAQALFAEFKTERDAASVIAQRDKNGQITGGELAEVLQDLADIRANTDDKRRERLGLQALADIDKEDLQNKAEKLEAKRDRLIATYREHVNAIKDIQRRNGELRLSIRDTVIEKAKAARQKAAERAAAPEQEAAAEKVWDGAFEAVAAGLPEGTMDVLEEHLLNRADAIVNGQGRDLGDVRAWMQEQADRFLRSIGFVQGRSDVALARQKDADRRQPAPIGRASIAVPDRSKDTSPGDRLRAADRRSSLLSRSIRAIR